MTTHFVKEIVDHDKCNLGDIFTENDEEKKINGQKREEENTNKINHNNSLVVSKTDRQEIMN